MSQLKQRSQSVGNINKQTPSQPINNTYICLSIPLATVARRPNPELARAQSMAAPRIAVTPSPSLSPARSLNHVHRRVSPRGNDAVVSSGGVQSNVRWFDVVVCVEIALIRICFFLFFFSQKHQLNNVF